MADQTNITRRSFIRGLPLATVAASIPALAMNLSTPHERVEHHIAELQKALTDLGLGPLQARVNSDGGVVVDPLDGKPFGRGVPPVLWRV